MWAAIASILGCGKQPPAKAAPAAKVDVLPREIEIGRITLTADAYQRLGITTAAVSNENVARHYVIGGDVTVPQGKSTVVSAPVAGTVTPPDNESIPLPGQWVEVGSPVLILNPLLSPERDVPTPAERVQIASTTATLLSALTVAKGEVARSQAEVQGAQIALRRAEQLLADKAGSRKDVETADAQLKISQATLKAALQREDQLTRLAAELQSPAGATHIRATPLSIAAPQSGVLRNLAVSPGQTVNAGTPLFEVADTSRMWIRAPLYVGMLDDVAPDAAARIVDLDGRAAFKPRPAEPVAAPPSADPLNVTADLYFETDNSDKQLRPGQRVGIDLTLRGSEEGLVVPAKAILYDIYGGTWVYAVVDERAFERRRVAVRFALDDRVVLDQGPAVGTQVVVDGTAELFGTEFGIGK